MRKVALDLGARKIAYCEVRDGQVIDRTTVASLSALLDRIGPNTAPACVLFEAGRSSWRVHAQLETWGHEPLILDTTRAKQIGIGQHGRKTDRIDAEVLARALEVGRIPLAHVLSPHRQELRYQLSVRRTLVETRAEHVATIREIARARGHQLPSCEINYFSGKLKAARLDEATRALITPLAIVLELLDAQIAITDEKLEHLSAQEPVIQVLKTAPGVASVVAAAFVSVIDDAGRFRRAHHVEAYLGLVPSEDTSGGRRRIGAITKQGNSYVRSLLVQSSWAILRGPKDDPLTAWGQSIAERRGKRIGVIAVARRLAGVLWSMWRHNTVYDPKRLGLASARGMSTHAQDIEFRAAALARAARKVRRRPKTSEASMSC
jgi:transposase